MADGVDTNIRKRRRLSFISYVFAENINFLNSVGIQFKHAYLNI